MRYCFIMANSRLGYFNIEKVFSDVGSNTRFVLIVAKQFLNHVPENFKKCMFCILPIDEVKFELCKEGIESLKVNPNELSMSCIACTDEKSLITAAELREHFDMNGTRVYQHVPFSSKRIMKQVLSICGVNVPKFVDFDGKNTKTALSEYHCYLKNLFGGSYVVKPLDGGGSADTAIVKDYPNLLNWYNNFYSNADSYTAEEFIGGTFYHCDSFVVNKEAKFAAVFEYLYPNLDFTFGKAIGGFPLLRNSELSNRALQFNNEVIKALEPPDGALHLEFFIKDQKIVFIEIGARPGGKTIVLCHEKNSGINLYEYTLRHELKLPLEFNIKENPFHSWVSLAKSPGIVKKLNVPVLNSKADIDWKIKIGDKIESFPSSLKDGVAADIILFNPDYDKLIEDVNILRTHKAYL